MLKTSNRRFDPAFLIQATGGTLAGEPGGSRVITDSRDDLRDALFVALAGPRFDGHDFAARALAGGASGVVVSARFWERNRARLPHALVVPDTLHALHDLARAHRRRRPVPLVAVTGSNGKTTTKELLAAALQSLGPVLKTSGNRNNHVGLPLTLLELEEEHRAAVVEIGLNHPGELRVLSQIAEPQVAVITGVAAAHLEGLASIEGVARAKAEIVEGLVPSGTLVLPHGLVPLENVLAAYGGRRLTFGWMPEADVHPARAASRGLGGWDVELRDGTRLVLRLPGRHAVENLMAALAAAGVLGVTAAQAQVPLEAVEPVPGRLLPRSTAGGVIVLDDTYNANPASLRAALALLEAAPGGGRRHAILGDMLELGPGAAALHRECGRGATFLDSLVVVGPLAAEIARGAEAGGLSPSCVHAARDGEEAAALLVPGLAAGDVVLVKGSRGMKLETAVSALLARLGGER